jgi:CheY-like chemotaxis protein
MPQMPKKVLLVDDEADFRQLVKEIILEHFEAVVFEACDGVDAVTKLRNDEFSVVITDLKMPRLSGTELLKSIQTNQNMYHIKMRTQQPKMIIMSGSIDAETVESINSAKNGKVRAINKPFDRGELVRELTPHLQIKISA